MKAATALTWSAALLAASVGLVAQREGAFSASRDHPAIGYTDGPIANTVTELIDGVEQGRVKLAFDPVSGYLRSVLDALAVPVESQVLVYSETSFQARKINRSNPRAVFFTDRVAVGWVRGGDIIEIAAQDPRQGMVFYQLPQATGGKIARSDKCLSCHLSWDTLAVPGPLVLSVFPRRSDSEYANGGVVDHASPIENRWGGWYVTGQQVPARQLGNLELLQPKLPAAGPRPVPAKPSLEGAFDLNGYPTAHSDVVALMVLEHQVHATNLITRAGWEYRVAGEMSSRVVEAVDRLVDYLLFTDEARLAGPIRGSSGFAQKFEALGPRDAKGRSLRDLQLDTRLMKYPCSYMVYSPGFTGLPEPVKDVVFARISSILSGKSTAREFTHLSPADRAAIAAILRDTIPAAVRHFL